MIVFFSAYLIILTFNTPSTAESLSATSADDSESMSNIQYA